MGLDLWALPVRLDSEPVRRLLSEPDVFEDVVSRPPIGRRDWGEPLPPVSRQLRAAHPDLDGWQHPYPDRSYEAARFVLDPVAMRAAACWEDVASTTAHEIVLGEFRLSAEHACGGQGIRWRASRAAFLQQAADVIDGLDLVAARRSFRVRELAELGTYKVDAREDEDELFNRVVCNLSGLARYYRSVADRGLDLIIQKD